MYGQDVIQTGKMFSYPCINEKFQWSYYKKLHRSYSTSNILSNASSVEATRSQGSLRNKELRFTVQRFHCSNKQSNIKVKIIPLFPLISTTSWSIHATINRFGEYTVLGFFGFGRHTLFRFL